MLLFGDEMGHTQQGNNNVYCQDNELSWLNWNGVDIELQNFCKEIIAFRKKHTVFARHCWFKDGGTNNALPDVQWFLPDGNIIPKNEWKANTSKCIGVFLKGDAVDDCSYQLEKLNDDSFFIVFNATEEKQSFKLPPDQYGKKWIKVLDTCNEVLQETDTLSYNGSVDVYDRSIIILKQAIR